MMKGGVSLSKMVGGQIRERLGCPCKGSRHIFSRLSPSPTSRKQVKHTHQPDAQERVGCPGRFIFNGPDCVCRERGWAGCFCFFPKKRSLLVSFLLFFDWAACSLCTESQSVSPSLASEPSGRENISSSFLFNEILSMTFFAPSVSNNFVELCQVNNN